MKAILNAVILLVALSGCWDEDKAKKSSDFMSTLTKCDNCKLEKPFLGGKKDQKDAR